jgi:hypothetical protein
MSEPERDPRQITVHQHLGIEEPAPVAPVNPRHLSQSKEHYTPKPIVDRAREVLGGIDLDPFSSEEANRTIGAATIYTGDPDDGFALPWRGRVFCNPPGGTTDSGAIRSNQKRAWFKLAEEHVAGRTTSAFFVCFSVELLQTTQVKTPKGLPLPLDFPICFPSRRIAYVRPGGEVGASPPHASCLILLPESIGVVACWNLEQIAMFEKSFADVGRTIVPRLEFARRKAA